MVAHLVGCAVGDDAGSVFGIDGERRGRVGCRRCEGDGVEGALVGGELCGGDRPVLRAVHVDDEEGSGRAVARGGGGGRGFVHVHE